MKIGILEAGLLREQMTGRFDPYPVMFERFLARAGHVLEIESYSVIGGEFPPSVYACDGWLITGSRHGVYENLPWMLQLQDFIRDLESAGVPLIGVCFGHQIIAQALGGEVVKSDKGWGVGLHRYRIDQPRPWMKDLPAEVGLYAFHQDQVIKCPPGAQVFSSSEFCPYAGLSYGDSIISVQAHPEFEAAYEMALLEAFGGKVLPAEVSDEAIASMSAGNEADTDLLADWFTRFLHSRQAVDAASNS